MRATFGDRTTRRYLTAQLLSLFGDTAMYLVLGVWAKKLTGSNAAAGLVFFVFMLPTLAAPAAGLLVDRFRRRPLLVAVDLVAAVCLLPLLLVDGSGRAWILYVVAGLYGACGLLISPAQSALLPLLVPSESLAGANGVLQTGKEMLRLFAPLAGTGLYVAFGSVAVVFLDMATFVAAAAMLATLPLHEPEPARSAGHWRADITAGLVHVRRTPALGRLLMATACCTAFFGFFETLIYAVADAVHKPASFVGVLMSAQAVGAVAGGATAAAVMRRTSTLRFAGMGLAIVALGMAALPTATLAGVLGGTAVFGFGVPWLVVAIVTAMQLWTPSGLRGRVSSVVDVAINIPTTVSIAVGAALISVVDYRLLILVTVVVTACAGAYLMLTRVAEPSVEQLQVELVSTPGNGGPAELLDRPAPAGLAHPAS